MFIASHAEILSENGEFLLHAQTAKLYFNIN